jgi:hypothetical protein
MIHPYDDLPLHQSSAPLLHPTSDSAGLYDRYFFNGFDRDGQLFFALALGVYPNRQVMDASFSVVVDGVQHNCRSSRRCSTDRTVTSVGSIDVQVVEPMLQHQITVNDHHGISADLTMRVVSAVIEEPTFVRRVEGRVVMDYTRITQFVEWSGWIDLDGERIELGDLGVVQGCRDRSWGIRGGSRALPGPATPPQFFWTWAPTLFDDMCTHLAVNDDAEGRAWHKSAAVTGRFAAGSRTIDEVTDAGQIHRPESVSSEIVWQSGTRWAESMTATIATSDGGEIVAVYEPVQRFQMSGLGYLHPQWGHGDWHGELDEARDEIALADVNPLDPTMVHVQQLCRVTSGDTAGWGVLEQLVLGPHAPSGFTGVLDGAS